MTVDTPVGDGVTAELLAEAIRVALIERLQARTGETRRAAHPLHGASMLGGLIATSIADKIESAGGSNDRR
ncbi:MAG: hypothetical protein AB7F22_07125 [Reyranella sp.]|uniref:hypothetical protein n=1 Tax=Reyranella sp. TaxID=1929291 RepID=UPI003D0DD11F